MAEQKDTSAELCEVTSPFGEVRNRIGNICQKLHIDEGIAAKLKHCKRELVVNFPVKMDDGAEP